MRTKPEFAIFDTPNGAWDFSKDFWGVCSSNGDENSIMFSVILNKAGDKSAMIIDPGFKSVLRNDGARVTKVENHFSGAKKTKMKDFLKDNKNKKTNIHNILKTTFTLIKYKDIDKVEWDLEL